MHVHQFGNCVHYFKVKKNALTPKHAAATIISGTLCMYINLALNGCRESRMDKKGTIQVLEIMSAPDLGYPSGKQQHIIQDLFPNGNRKFNNPRCAHI